MATINPFTGGSAALSAVPEEYQPRALENIQQQRMAQLLMQQAMQGQPQGQMVSGHYVKPSPYQNLATIANQALGMYAGYQADKGQLELAKAIREGDRSAMADYIATKEGKPAVMQNTELAGPYAGNVPMPVATKELSPAIPPNARGAYAKLLTDPRASAKLQDFAFTKMNEGPMKVGIDDVLLDPNTFQPIYQGAGKLPATLDVAVSLIPNLPRNRAEWSPTQMAQVEAKVRQLEKDKANVTHINIPTEGERKAGFMSTILDKNILQMQTALGIDPKAVKPNVPASIVEAVTGPTLLSRSMTPAQRQIVEDSQLDVLDAALTLRTGAAYTPVQLTAMRATYFPVLGDKPAAIAAKKQRLETLLEGAYIAAGRATPARVSSPPPAVPPAPNANKELNIPTVNKPRFLGFEPALTGQQ
jgi:hypothetical protein